MKTVLVLLFAIFILDPVRGADVKGIPTVTAGGAAKAAGGLTKPVVAPCRT
jgi:hypothetical protein